ncbi:MAG: dihydroneopterin aldolase [Prevotellaceae bacterium]|nr:dihydroneopterin aldolase [Prevotellaceae bacterium]
MTAWLVLKGLRFYACHGVGEQERLTGNEFTVDLRLNVGWPRAIDTDEVADTVNYADVYEAVKAEMGIPSRLLEHAGGRIVKRLFRAFPSINSIELKLLKRNPPMGADMEAAGVELHCDREGFMTGEASV